MSKSTHVCQVAFCAFDAAALRRWYRDVFGLLESGGILFLPPLTTQVQGVKGGTETCRWLVDEQDYFQLEFFCFLKPKSKPRPSGWKPSDIGYTTLGIHVGDFDATLARLETVGSEPITAPMGNEGARRVCAKDPEGNIVEIFEADPFTYGETAPVRPELGVCVRSMVVSVPDLEKARAYFADTLGLTVVEGETLHAPEHEALWGLTGAKAERLLLRSENFLVELVQYRDPVPSPWPEGYRVCDHGFMNIALGYRTTDEFDSAFQTAVEQGARPNGKPVSLAGGTVMYVNDAAGFSVEMLTVKKFSWTIFGFNPRYAYVENEIRIDASPEAVWEVLADHDTMGDWCLFKGKTVREGTPDPRGKGTRRQMRGLGMKILEEIIEWEPNHRFAYTVLKGGGVKDYRGDLVLTPEEGGTRLRWSIRFRPKLPGGGKASALLLKRIFANAVKNLKAKVEAR